MLEAAVYEWRNTVLDVSSHGCDNNNNKFYSSDVENEAVAK